MTPQQKAKDRRLRKQYRWTLEMYNILGEYQKWRCAACGREAKTMPLNVDHFHFKVLSYRSPLGFPSGKWTAVTNVNGHHIMTFANTKVAAEQLVRDAALPLSVRGLLCAGRYAGCNRKLGRIDSLPWLASVLDYLSDPPARKACPNLHSRSQAEENTKVISKT